MDRRQALALSAAVALVVVAAVAAAADLGLFGFIDRAEPVGQLSPVVTVGSTSWDADDRQRKERHKVKPHGRPADDGDRDEYEHKYEDEPKHEPKPSEDEHERDD